MVHPQRTSFVLALFALLVVILTFLPSLQNDFVNWDDDVHLLGNPAVIGPDIQQALLQTVNKTYIPLTTLSFTLEHYFFKDRPFIYHLNNLLLHLVVVGLVFVLAQRLGLSSAASAIAALIFGIHPLHVESVAWVTERKDVLYSSFYLLAVLSYWHYLKTGKRGFLGLTVGLGFLSGLAKPMALSLPFILALLDWYDGRRFSKTAVIEKLFLLAAIIPVVFMTYFWQARVPGGTDWSQAFLIWIWCFDFYIFKFFAPGELTIFYWLPKPISLANPVYLGSCAFLAALLAALWIFRRQKLLVFAFAYYFLSIFFLLRLDNFSDANMVADRFMYLPSLGLCLFMGASVEQYLMKVRERPLALWTAVVVLALLAGSMVVKTQRQIDVWKNGVTLWGHQLKHEPRVATALIYDKLGYARMSAGDLTPEVLALYQKAVEIKPDFIGAYFHLGLFYERLGDHEKAVQFYEKTLALEPAHFAALNQLKALRPKP